MSQNKNQKNQQKVKYQNPIETLKDIGASTVNGLGKDILGQMPDDFMDHLFGPPPAKKYTGEITQGESIEMAQVMSGKQELISNERKQLTFERRLFEEERSRVEKKSNELKIQLKMLMDELLAVAKQTEGLAEEVEVAAMQAPADPGVYHLIFFEKLLEFMKSFRKKIEEARVWLHGANKRAGKKNMWGQNYKKSGGKYLLSSEHYLQRSAG